MLGATIVSGERGHMNIPVLVDRFNPTMRKACLLYTSFYIRRCVGMADEGDSKSLVLITRVGSTPTTGIEK